MRRSQQHCIVASTRQCKSVVSRWATDMLGKRALLGFSCQATSSLGKSKQAKSPAHALKVLTCGAPRIISFFILAVARDRPSETLRPFVPLRAVKSSHNATYCDLLNRSHATYSAKTLTR